MYDAQVEVVGVVQYNGSKDFLNLMCWMLYDRPIPDQLRRRNFVCIV